VLTNACADFTWALILAITGGWRRRARRARRRVGGWALDYMLGMELRGKQLGLSALAASAARLPTRHRPSA
jgi:lactate dehydrogenase-like 2-hydroxyacid dehydrogenase